MDDKSNNLHAFFEIIAQFNKLVNNKAETIYVAALLQFI